MAVVSLTAYVDVYLITKSYYIYITLSEVQAVYVLDSILKLTKSYYICITLSVLQAVYVPDMFLHAVVNLDSETVAVAIQENDVNPAASFRTLLATVGISLDGTCIFKSRSGSVTTLTYNLGV